MITIEQLRFTWPAQPQPILDIESFAVGEGEHVFLKGPSGSGKSTLLSLIAGIHTPQSGTLTVNHQALTALNDRQRDQFRANHIGYIFQQFNLLPYLSVIDNVTVPLRFSHTRRQALSQPAHQEAANLLDKLGLPAHCYHQPVTALSIGQQQRVAAARALIGAPALIIADEPTSALDADTRNTFIQLLQDRCREANSSLLFVSHDSQLAPLFDRDVSLLALNRAIHREEANQ
ncbi:MULTISPECIES: ABC transporter ATP-binding protein [unclassified Salinivibrio]|uniref:ABC transporter ATP-binding protein n=1 Tax=unclassified Salinivibrio TaxID=2636825 RepID=UPI0009851A30|nr:MULTISPECIES: ABC transporter ATP-binding protein [unclassified Salinivibrio]OOF13093.1 methionine ABC transporter ATP-binding protein [Salinivibrio sp. PR919]OOF17247.1 methionine ABC transporter ATP-binding protein [Salinivibrio sp. PR932]